MKKQKLYFGNRRNVDHRFSYWVNGTLKRLPGNIGFRRDILFLVKHHPEWRTQLDKILTLRENFANVVIVPEVTSWADTFKPKLDSEVGQRPMIGALYSYQEGENRER